MKVALATHMLRPYLPEGRAPWETRRRNTFLWARRHGFDGIEVGSWWHDFYDSPVAETKQLKEEMADHGLELIGFKAPGVSVNFFHYHP